MGRKARLKKLRKRALPKYSEGERILLNDPDQHMPKGIYTYQGTTHPELGLVFLSAGEALVGIQSKALRGSRKLTPAEANLPEISVQELARHNLAQAKASGEAECECCKELAGCTH